MGGDKERADGIGGGLSTAGVESTGSRRPPQRINCKYKFKAAQGALSPKLQAEELNSC